MTVDGDVTACPLLFWTLERTPSDPLLRYAQVSKETYKETY